MMLSRRTGERGLVLAVTIAAIAAVTSGSIAQESSQTAEYTARFDAMWSKDTHPLSFPDGPHFSGLMAGRITTALFSGSLAS